MVRIPAFLVLLMAGMAVAAQPATTSASTGVLVVAPAPRLGVDLPELERGAEAFELPAGPESLAKRPAGPTADAAWRGAKTGFVVGASIGALLTAAALVGDLSDGGLSCDFICAWQVAAMGSVLLTAGTTAIGALVGAANASGRRPTNPPPRN